ncbi:uncharacterized protein N7518_008740 [Penicillium psychrosexuale]|uniref:uncharacterized protein n=1 Tax=Penicillium psychrosexuale TaxID=1002107 RepID=UPI0025451D34|nr:uncharacterized protein N7518_008740 [Penicillium psychrosexuale]KAJ5791729.1 hypothetical protein N7518_008740 [Penicillium psychrosexuale]
MEPGPDMRITLGSPAGSWDHPWDQTLETCIEHSQPTIQITNSETPDEMRRSITSNIPNSGQAERRVTARAWGRLG